jgi:hypothetical protein
MVGLSREFYGDDATLRRKKCSLRPMAAAAFFDLKDVRLARARSSQALEEAAWSPPS